MCLRAGYLAISVTNDFNGAISDQFRTYFASNTREKEKEKESEREEERQRESLRIRERSVCIAILTFFTSRKSQRCSERKRRQHPGNAAFTFRNKATELSVVL